MREEREEKGENQGVQSESVNDSVKSDAGSNEIKEVEIDGEEEVQRKEGDERRL